MSEYEDLRADLLRTLDAVNGYGASTVRYMDENTRRHEELWKDNADLRDELHAVANRLEALTAFVTSNPAEVAAKIVNDSNRATLREVKNDD